MSVVNQNHLSIIVDLICGTTIEPLVEINVVNATTFRRGHLINDRPVASLSHYMNRGCVRDDNSIAAATDNL
jgi:hypothetical protein